MWGTLDSGLSCYPVKNFGLGERLLVKKGVMKEMKAIQAVYKNRVFKPLEVVELEEDTKVIIQIERDIVEEMTGIIMAKKEIVDDVVENEEYYEP